MLRWKDSIANSEFYAQRTVILLAGRPQRVAVDRTTSSPEPIHPGANVRLEISAAAGDADLAPQFALIDWRTRKFHNTWAPMHIPNPQNILNSIRRIVRALRLASRHAEARFGLSGAQLFVLQALKDGSSLTINELGERTYTHQSSVSTIVTKLEEAGFLSRTQSRSDARRKEVKITTKGKKLLKMKIELGQSRLLTGISKLTSRERQVLSGLLEKLVQQSGFSDRPASMFFEEDKK